MPTATKPQSAANAAADLLGYATDQFVDFGRQTSELAFEMLSTWTETVTSLTSLTSAIKVPSIPTTATDKDAKVLVDAGFAAAERVFSFEKDLAATLIEKFSPKPE